MTLRAALIWVLVGLAVADTKCPHKDPTLKKWSDASTWQGNQNNPSKDNSTVTVDKRVLVDVQPSNDINSLVIKPGAELVFSPDVKIELRARSILVEGTLTVGSETCLYEGKLTITIIGHINDTYEHPDFGKKFIGVPIGGSVEIHGKYKKSWTKLTKTLPALPPSAVIFQDKITQEDKIQGLMVYAFNPDSGKPVGGLKHFGIRRKTQARTDSIIQALDNHLKSVNKGLIVAMAIRKSIMHKENPMDLSKLFDTIETYAFGSVNNKSLIRNAKFYDGFSIAFVQGDPSKTVQKFDSYKAGGVKQTSTATMILRDKGKKLEVSSVTSSRGHAKSHVIFLFTYINGSLPIIDVAGDVTSWKPGDVVAIASTDYDWTQMEYGTVIDCEGKCTNKQVQLDLTAAYTHYGEVYKNVDMRAAIALLSRDLVIQGLMANGDDTFGAHVKGIKGMKGLRIQNAELAHMGQNDGLGKYPIHYHMIGASTPKNTYVKGNAIHHTYARCITIHATFNVTVSDNSCTESEGHGYFSEDGAELNTIFEGNVGFGQRRGRLIATDRFPSTFYLTNPQTILRGNYAAGSQGNGFWWLFPEGPAAQPEGYNGTFVHTKVPITEYYNNVASGNARFGHTINGRILQNLKYKPTSNYQPNSEVLIEKNTGFKNSAANFNFRGDNLTLTGLSSADAPYGYQVEGVRDTPQLSNSVIIGDSENKGNGVFDKNKTKIWDWSLPLKSRHRPISPRLGLWVPGTPFDVDGVWFSGFSKTPYYNAGAIAFRRSWRDSSLQSYITNAEFAYNDPNGNRVLAFDINSRFSSKKEYSILRDFDGSLTSVKGSFIVRPTDFHMTENCVKRTNWNMAICSEQFVQVQPFFKSTKTNRATMVRLDNKATATGPNRHTFNLMVDYVYAINWSEDIPTSFTIKGRNIDWDNNVLVGVCVPKGSKPVVKVGMRKASRRDSLEKLVCKDHYYYEEDVGIVFVRLMTNINRGPDDYRECPGGHCASFMVSAKSNNQTNKDCIQNFFKKYLENPAKRAVIARSSRMRRELNVPKVLQGGYADPPEAWGAGPQF